MRFIYKIIVPLSGFVLGGVLSPVIQGNWDELLVIPWFAWLAIGMIIGQTIYYLIGLMGTSYLHLQISQHSIQRLTAIQTREGLRSFGDVLSRSLAYYDGISDAMNCGAEVIFRYPDGDEQVVVLQHSEEF